MKDDLFATRQFADTLGYIRLSQWAEGLVFWVGGEIAWRSFDWPRASSEVAKLEKQNENLRFGVRVNSASCHILADRLLPEIANLRRQNADLQAANSRLLERARNAEASNSRAEGRQP